MCVSSVQGAALAIRWHHWAGRHAGRRWAGAAAGGGGGGVILSRSDPSGLQRVRTLNPELVCCSEV